MPDNTIARAVSHIDSVEDDRDPALFDAARLTAQLAVASQHTAETVEMEVWRGFALGSGRSVDPAHPPRSFGG